MNKLLYDWQALPLGPHLSSPLQSYFGCCEVILPGTTYIFKVKILYCRPDAALETCLKHAAQLS